MSQTSPPPTDPPDLTQLLAMIDDLRQHNETLQDNVQALQLKSLDDAEDPEVEPLEPSPCPRRSGRMLFRITSNPLYWHRMMARQILRSTLLRSTTQWRSSEQPTPSSAS